MQREHREQLIILGEEENQEVERLAFVERRRFHYLLFNKLPPNLAEDNDDIYFAPESTT